MLDRHVSVFHLIAAMLWTLGAVAIAARLFAVEKSGLAEVGVYLALAAATLNIRAGLQHMEQRQLEREQNAFLLGRDSARRGGSDARNMR